MKLLIVSQYFWPENFRVNELSRDLLERGHEVTVLTGIPNYPEGQTYIDYSHNKEKYKSYHGVKVIRVPMFTRGSSKFKLFLNYLSYPITSTIYVLFNQHKLKIDKVLIYQLSPIFLALPGVILKIFFKKRVVMWTLDLWPETLLNYGITKQNIIYKCVKIISDFFYKNIDFALFQTKALEEKFLASNNSINEKVKYFPSWADDVFNDIDFSKEKTSNEFKILFAGNIGDAQDYESILSCMRLLENEDRHITLDIVGSGSSLQKFKFDVEKENIKNIQFHGRHHISKMPMFYKNADLLLVSLKDSPAFKLVLPAKVQTYMLAGKPIVTMLNGETNRIIEEAGCGLVASAGDFLKLSKNIVKLKNLDHQKLSEMGERGKNYCKKNYSKSTLLVELERILENL